MASIPLPALSINTSQPNPIEQYARLQQIKNAQTQQQTAQLQQTGLEQENQQRALALQDSQTLRSLAPQHVVKDADGNVTGFDMPGLIKDAAGKGVDPNRLTQMQNQYAESVKNLTGAQETLRTNEQAKNKALYETFESLRSIQDPQQRQAALQQALPTLQKQGVDTSKINPNSPLDDKALDLEEAGLGVHAQMIADAKTNAETQEKSASAALTNIKVNLSKNSKPGDFDSQIDAIAPPSGTSAALNTRTKAMVNSSLQRGDFEGAQRAIQAASSEIGAIEKETNPDVQANRLKLSIAEGAARNAMMNNTGLGNDPAAVAKQFGMSLEAFDQAAEKYWTSGQLPPAGRGGPALAMNRAIMNRTAELHPEGSLAASSAEY